MKHCWSVLSSLLWLCGSFALQGQGTFVNLDFEQANVSGYPSPSVVPISAALPGWNGYINGNLVDRVDYNTSSLGGPSISLESSLSPAYQPIQGSYSVYLKSFSDQGGTSAAIGQTGQIPGDALSLLFLRVPSSGFFVSFGG